MYLQVECVRVLQTFPLHLQRRTSLSADENSIGGGIQTGITVAHSTTIQGLRRQDHRTFFSQWRASLPCSGWPLVKPRSLRLHLQPMGTLPSSVSRRPHGVPRTVVTTPIGDNLWRVLLTVAASTCPAASRLGEVAMVSVVSL